MALGLNIHGAHVVVLAIARPKRLDLGLKEKERADDVAWRSVVPRDDLVREVRERVARGRRREPAARVDGHLGLRDRERLGAREAVGRAHARERGVDVAGRSELARDERPERCLLYTSDAADEEDV